MHLYERWDIDSAGKGLSVRMLMILLSALESDEDRHKFIALYEKYHARMEQTAMRILKEQLSLLLFRRLHQQPDWLYRKFSKRMQ